MIDFLSLIVFANDLLYLAILILVIVLIIYFLRR